jgi:hypothetical protein
MSANDPKQTRVEGRRGLKVHAEAARWAQRHGRRSAANPEQELVKDDA